ncbi:hypothetical protein JXA85_04115 [Candidatus Woesearchaeota archaeon]|nr:hypothetical protein [Candidatus Woesearchaeota archaeon]
MAESKQAKAAVLAVQRPLLRRSKMQVLVQAPPNYLAGFQKILSSPGSKYRVEPAGEQGFHVHYKIDEEKEKKIATVNGLDDKVIVTFHKPNHDGTKAFRNHFESYSKLSYEGPEHIQAANKEAYTTYFNRKSLIAKLGLGKKEAASGQKAYAH